MSGFVSFVSSGPGDPELLTVRAVKRLEAADAILFDDLASGPILAHAKRGAELIAVGKRAGRPSPKQEYVSALLVEHALSGAHVVRLKSGDSGIFGRLEEELIAVREAGLRYEIVPGLTSAHAAAAAAGIPLTRRLESRRIQFVTGADVTGGMYDDANMGALADPAATTVVFMGKRTWPKLAAMLIDAGLPGDTPALFAENVSKPDQLIRRSTVAKLKSVIADASKTSVALILYGPLAEDDLED